MKNIITIFVFSCLLYGCGDSPESNSQEWVSDEVMLQLQDVKKELRLVNQKLDELKATGVKKQPSSAAQASNLDLPVRFLGDKKAQIAILEFTDFQCPYCAKHHKDTFPKIQADYIDTGKIRYYMRDYPLSFHKKAKKAAIVARCAGEQNKFWEMYHELFSNYRDLGDELYTNKANELGLTPAVFNSCLSNPEMDRLVNADITFGNKAGVRGTPRFFVGRIKNGKLVDIISLSGAQAIGAFAGAIDSLKGKRS